MKGKATKKTQGMYFTTRSTERAQMREAISARRRGDIGDGNRATRRKSDNKLMRLYWQDKQIARHGKKAYFEMRTACDPRGRHDLKMMLV